MNEQDFQNMYIYYDKIKKFIKSMYELEKSEDFYIIVDVRLVNRCNGNEYTFKSSDEDNLDVSEN